MGNDSFFFITPVWIITTELIFMWSWLFSIVSWKLLHTNISAHFDGAPGKSWKSLAPGEFLFVLKKKRPPLTYLLLSLQLSGGCELTVVIHDFVASNGSSGELSVRRGQTVEVLERLHDKPDWCLVRTTDRSPAQEGIVPCSMLCIAHSRSSMEMEGLFNHKGRRISSRTFALSLNSCHTKTGSNIIKTLGRTDRI